MKVKNITQFYFFACYNSNNHLTRSFLMVQSINQSINQEVVSTFFQQAKKHLPSVKEVLSNA